MVRTSFVVLQSLVARRREKQKFGVFVMCLFVWILNRGLVIQIAILSPFVSQFWCGFQHSLEEKCSFKHLRDIWTMPQGGATFVLELGQNFLIFLKIPRAKIVRTTSTI